jgi:hypothetical protein
MPSKLDLTRTEGVDEAVLATIDSIFTFQPWSPEQIAKGKLVRNSLAAAYESVISNVPASPTRTRALNAIIDARMLANAAITFKGEL